MKIRAGQTLIIEFWRCEMDDAIEFMVSPPMFKTLVETLESTGIRVETREVTRPEMFGLSDDPGRHRWRAVMRAVHEVQGEKLQEGQSVLPALERLVTKYVELK